MRVERVDEIIALIHITTEDIAPTPNFGNWVRTDFILGMGKVEERIVVLLDVDRLLSREELGTLHR